jgi:FMN phosphatase YigB (HAD superfamily)
MRTAPPISALVTDLDNTLWDWFAIWHAGFSALMDGLIAESGVEQSTLEREIRVIHQANGTSEYPPELLLPLLPSLAVLSDREALLTKYDDAIHAFHKARKDAVRLYPGVMETLKAVRESGCMVLAYTESLAFVTTQRLLRVGLDGMIDHLYSPPDHDLPSGVALEKLRRYDAERYTLKRTISSKTPPGERKPNPGILKSILADARAEPSTTVYVGDSRMKDVAMAQAVGVVDVLAAYGEVQTRDGYDLLQRVSHWPDEDVQSEQLIIEHAPVQPTVTLSVGFGELLDNFTFGGERTHGR